MKKNLLFFIFFLSFVVVHAQQDSIFIDAKLSEDVSQVYVQQEFNYKNNFTTPLRKIKLLNWIAAYKNTGTSLGKRKSEDRKKDLYFAKTKDIGKLEYLKIGDSAITDCLEDENIFIFLKKPLQPGESTKLNLSYNLHLPQDIFTGYGVGKEKIALKYFFIVPDSFETDEQLPKYYNDIEETQHGNTFWNIKISVPNDYFTESNLKKISENDFAGRLSTDPEFLISKTVPETISAHVDGQNVETVFGYKISEKDLEYLRFYLPLHLKFIKDKTDYLPGKLFISEKFRNKEDFFGNNDIKFWKFKFQLFDDAQKIDLDYISILSKAVIDQTFTTERTKDHWLKNGLKTYLEAQYLRTFYSETKLLGKLPDDLSIFGIKPLKKFTASKMKLTERYGLAYQYIMSQNLDQKIGEPYTVLSNFNDMAISNFETGSLFDFISQKMSPPNFDAFLKNYISENQGTTITSKDFLNQLAVASRYSSDFLEQYIQKGKRINFSLKNFKREGNQFHVKIKKNTDLSIPFKITTENKSGEKTSYWYDTSAKKSTQIYTIPQTEAEKILINDEYIFPEANYRDNYLYTRGIFSNMKRPKFKFFKDIPNPEFNEIYLSPILTFNAYDKVLFGINFQNQSLFEQNLLYNLTPYYSTGTHSMAGSGAISYSIKPQNSFFRNLQFGISGSYFHYDYDLAYQKYSVFSSINLNKNPRSSISRSFMASYNFFKKDLPLEKIDKEYGEYSLWNFGFGYNDNKIIHELYFNGNLQLMEDFQKLAAEGFYRWEYARNKKIAFRIFAGYFLSNKTQGDLFDFGISRVSNYAFSYSMLGQSATSGILSQQFVLAEGGFKSYINNTVNQWITSTNIDAHLWKWFNVYADAGLYKNKMHNPKFIWDSGIKVKVIPDFLEVYLPIQSSLGFEPKFKDYGQRIRYTLVFNLGALTNYFRRGWF